MNTGQLPQVLKSLPDDKLEAFAGTLELEPSKVQLIITDTSFDATSKKTKLVKLWRDKYPDASADDLTSAVKKLKIDSQTDQGNAVKKAPKPTPRKPLRTVKKTGDSDEDTKDNELSKIEVKEKDQGPSVEPPVPLPRQQRKPDLSVIDDDDPDMDTGPSQFVNLDKVSDDYKNLKCIPLCFPDNYQWDKKKGCLVKINESRTKLIVCEDALAIINSIQGPICPIAVVGPARTGKSYIASQLQEPNHSEGIFQTSKSMRPETFGIWISTQPFKKKLNDGTDVTVILFDSEGIDSYAASAQDDTRIFTLCVLLSSVLIYNSQGVPKSHDLQQLRGVANLASRLQVRSQESKEILGESELADSFFKFFPNFMWLFRDVTMMPVMEKENGNMEEVEMNEYIVGEVLKRHKETDDMSPIMKEHNAIRTAILTHFPVFDSWQLPIPSGERKVLANLGKDEYRSRINQKFLEGVDVFKDKVFSQMKPKKAWPHVGNISGGQDFAKLIQVYVQALDTPGAISNVYQSWDTVLQVDMQWVIKNAFRYYKQKMRAFLHCSVPCSEKELLMKHNEYYSAAVAMITNDVNKVYNPDKLTKHMEQLKKKIAVFDKDGEECSEGLLKKYMDYNAKESEQYCMEVVEQLKAKAFKPMQAKIDSGDEKVTYEYIKKVLQEIDTTYDYFARGPRALDVKKKQIMLVVQKFYADNVKYISNLPDFKTAEGIDEFKKSYELYLQEYEEWEKANIAEQRKHQTQTNEIAELNVLHTNMKRERTQRQKDGQDSNEILRAKIKTFEKNNQYLAHKMKSVKETSEATLIRSRKTLDTSMKEIENKMETLKKSVHEERLPPTKREEKKSRCSIQ